MTQNKEIKNIKFNVSFYNNRLNKQYKPSDYKIKRILYKFMPRLKDLNYTKNINYNCLYDNDKAIRKEITYIFDSYSNNVNNVFSFIKDLNKILEQKEVYIEVFNYDNQLIENYNIKDNGVIKLK